MSQDDALVTLSLLEGRLRRLEFLLNGSVDLDGVPVAGPKRSHNETVAAGLTRLEDDLSRLISKSTLVQDVLRLWTRYPDLFDASGDSSTSKSTNISTIASVVLAHSSIYPETASRLSSLQTLPIPHASASAQLLDLQPRIQAALLLHEQQNAEVGKLRAQSAMLLEWWVNNGIVGMGECWADWETRVRDCGRAVVAMEAKDNRNE